MTSTTKPRRRKRAVPEAAPLGESISRSVPRDQTPIKADIDRVFDIATEHELYTAPELGPGTVKNLPSVDDCTQYDVTVAEQKMLWREEITRLIGVVEDLGKPISFRGSKLLDESTKPAHEALSHLADKAWCCLNIITHDAQVLYHKNVPALFNEAEYGGAREQMLREVEDVDEDDGDIAVAPPQISSEDFFSLIDYVTAVLARVFCTSASGQEFHNRILACLAKLSTAMKILSTNTREYTETSLQNPVAVSAGLKPGHRNPAPEERATGDGVESSNRMEETLGRLQHSAAAIAVTAPSELKTRLFLVKFWYWHNTIKYRLGILAALRSPILSLRGGNTMLAGAATSFDICSMVYETGFEHFPTLIHQNRDGEFHATSDLHNVNFAHAIFQLLEKSICDIQAKRNDPDSSQPPPMNSHRLSGARTLESIRTGARTEEDPLPPINVSWRYRSEETADPENPGQNQRYKWMQLRSVNDVVTVMVPLVMTNPSAVDAASSFLRALMLTQLRDRFSQVAQDTILPHKQAKLSAFFSLATDDYVAAKDLSNGVPLSQGPMAQDRLVKGRRLGRLPSGPFPPLGDTCAERHPQEAENIKKRGTEIAEAKKEMSEWIFDEKGVIVACGWYVWTLMAACTALVLGGVAIGFTVHNRVPGVDPFNITTYCWVLAAFVVLVFKSLRVETWPWRLFLLRKVYCRSLSELHAVTRINEQLILAKLLHDESTTILQTRGPYNCAFNRKADDGFSIDRPLSTWTMLQSGLIMVQVQSPRGLALVCLDARRGRGSASVCHDQVISDSVKTYIVCDSLPEGSSDEEDIHQPLRLKRAGFAWHRVMGLYNAGERFYV